MDKTNKISDRFRAVRKQLGLTQQQLAEALYLSRNYIAKIESDAQEPAARVVRDLESLRVAFENKRGTESTWQVHDKAAPWGDASKPLTRQQVEAYLGEYLDLAEQVPGAIEHAYIELTEALSLEKIRRRVRSGETERKLSPVDRKIAALRREAEAETAAAQRKGEHSA